MELNNRKNEVNSEHKLSAIAIEVGALLCHMLVNTHIAFQELHHKATIKISDLR